jgi:hypothetical protein
MEWLSDPVVTGCVQWLLALVFALSSAGKLRNRAAFAGVLMDYRLLPDALVSPLALVIPFVEAVVALALLLEDTRATAAAWAAGLIVLFSVAVWINLLRGRTHIDCGCFGGAFRQRISGWLLARNAVLLAAVVFVGTADAPSRAAHWLDYVTMIAGAASILFAIGAWSSVNNITATAPSRPADPFTPPLHPVERK